MKRFSLLAPLLLIFAGSVFAQSGDRDILVTPDGTFFTAEAVTNDLPTMAASKYIHVTMQKGDINISVTVPDSTTPGFHSAPALAFDDDSKTLFVVWLHAPNLMSSELLLATYADGKWQPALSIDNQAFHIRNNLRMAITHSVQKQLQSGEVIDTPALLLHLLWWEETGKGEEARYGLLSLENGRVASAEIHSLSELYSDPAAAAKVDAGFNREILRHPAFLHTTSPNSIDVIAGDVTSLSFHRLTIRPVLDSRIRIPVGKGPADHIDVPKSFSADWSGRTGVISSPRSGILALTNIGSSAVNYLTWSAGSWSPLKSIPLDNRISVESALGALGRLVDAQ